MSTLTNIATATTVTTATTDTTTTTTTTTHTIKIKTKPLLSVAGCVAGYLAFKEACPILGALSGFYAGLEIADYVGDIVYKRTITKTTPTQNLPTPPQ